MLVVTKTAKVSVSGVGLGLDPAGLGLGLPGLGLGLGLSGLGLGLPGLDNISVNYTSHSHLICTENTENKNKNKMHKIHSGFGDVMK